MVQRKKVTLNQPDRLRQPWVERPELSHLSPTPPWEPGRIAGGLFKVPGHILWMHLCTNIKIYIYIYHVHNITLQSIPFHVYIYIIHIYIWSYVWPVVSWLHHPFTPPLDPSRRINVQVFPLRRSVTDPAMNAGIMVIGQPQIAALD
jgi:hypothetical protein